MIKGYKSFDNNGNNNFGKHFEEGSDYHIDGPLVAGLYNQKNSNGYHICKNLEDVFRFSDAKNGNYKVAEVYGYGNSIEFDDDYYGYYDMYVVSDLHINRFLDRKEIIDIVLSDNNYLNVIKFLATFKLNKEEILLFLNKYEDEFKVRDAILYYQCGITNIYTMNLNDRVKTLNLFKDNNIN